MKKTILLFSVILLALSCRKDVIDKVVNLASLSADYEAKDGETLTGILGGNYKITIADGATVKAEGVNSISAAGIGSGVDNSVCGDILISGGTVDATGGDCSAGIGTGEKASVGNITITSGVTKVTAARGADAQSHSIGGGTDYKRLGTVTIGGKAGPVSESPFVYIP